MDIETMLKSNVDLQDKEEYATLLLWDFAGDEEFYHTHQTFLSSGAIYLVVTKLNEADDKNAQDLFQLWMDSIHCYSRLEEDKSNSDDSKSSDDLDPPVVIVGTWKDAVTSDVEEIDDAYRENIFKFTENMSEDELRHIRQEYFISNTEDDPSVFQQIREDILNLARKIKTWNKIKAQLLCESELENKNNSCCFPNCRMDCVQLCPEEYFLIHNNSKVLCSRKGEIEDIQMFNTHFSGKPFCARTCPDGFQASVFTCIECKTPCNVQKLVKFSNTTETHTKHKTFEMKIIAVVSSVAVVAIVAIVISVIVCCLEKNDTLHRGTEQTKHINREASEIELGNKNGVKLADSENVEDPDGRRRMVNGYVTDPTTGIKVSLMLVL
ncbi:unnamed protein product [Mytilus coruscus]|uniref:Uncharacterized protein n=1 Tax=Mytilus coruscus TaxID=42192 RepID=A0A6J8E4F3_MYTCO|nr:unnamed protein product [Mytilus coruscus]